MVRPALPNETKNIVLLSAAALLESLQLLLVAGCISTFIGFDQNFKVFLEFIDTLHPEHEMGLYRIFIISVAVMAIGGVWCFRRRLAEAAFTRTLTTYVLFNALVVGTQVFLAAKLMAYDGAGWAKTFFFLSLIVGILAKIFTKEILAWRGKQQPALVWDLSIIAGIVFLLAVPDIEKLLAFFFINDAFFHLDTSAITPALLSHHGGKVGVDLVSYYGPGFPVFLDKISSLWGGLSYHAYVALMMIIIVGYFILFYAFLRQWLGSVALAAFGVLWAMQWQMFHSSIAPLVLQFPSATVLRFCLDMPFFLLLLAHSRQGSLGYLAGAGIVCGVALTHFVDTGLYMLMGFYAYVAATCIVTYGWRWSWKRIPWPPVITLMALPLATAFTILWLINGSSVFHAQIWAGIFDQANLTLKGWLANPMSNALREHQPWVFAQGVLIPLFYAGIVAVMLMRLVLEKARMADAFVLALCVYGLALYHYYILHSVGDVYLALSIPAVALGCWLIGKYADRMAVGILVFIAALTLLTNDVFIRYPNVLSLMPLDWAKAQEQYRQYVPQMQDDTAMVARLTAPGERVAIISSLETKFLLDAGRQPFFYYAPMMRSSWFDNNEFRGTTLFTVPMLQKSLDQMERERPEYLFVDKKVFMGELPPRVYQYSYSLRHVMDYVKGHYHVAEAGKYLMALKRNESNPR